MAISDIKEIRLLPSLAVARFGSSPEPMDNYDVVLPPHDPAHGQDGTGFRSLVPAPTLTVVDGRISQESTPDRVAFRDAEGRVRPVAPFLEIWARFEDDGDLEPLTRQHLSGLNLNPRDVRWRVEVVNQKAFRRTGDPNDRVIATVDDIRDHTRRPLEGSAGNFKAGKSIPFGYVQYIEPTLEFPEIRLRFTPAAGRVFGPRAGDPNLADDVYDSAKGNWDNYRDDLPNVPIGIVPAASMPAAKTASVSVILTMPAMALSRSTCGSMASSARPTRIWRQGRRISHLTAITCAPPAMSSSRSCTGMKFPEMCHALK